MIDDINYEKSDITVEDIERSAVILMAYHGDLMLNEASRLWNAVKDCIDKSVEAGDNDTTIGRIIETALQAASMVNYDEHGRHTIDEVIAMLNEALEDSKRYQKHAHIISITYEEILNRFFGRQSDDHSGSV